MADIIDTPLRLFCELDKDGALAGRYQLEFQRRVEQDGVEIVKASVQVRDLTPEEGAALLASGAAEKAAEVQALAQVNTGLQEDAKAAREERDAEVAAAQETYARALTALRSIVNAANAALGE